MLGDLFDAGWVDPLLDSQAIKPVEEEADILAHDDWGFSVDQDVCIEKSAHVRQRLVNRSTLGIAEKWRQRRISPGSFLQQRHLATVSRLEKWYFSGLDLFEGRADRLLRPTFHETNRRKR